MSYNIYKHILETDFNILHQRILNLIPCFNSKLVSAGFNMSSEANLADILGLDFIYNDKNIYGNLGFMFNDEIHKQSFTFYITKAVDINKYRYFKKVIINQNLKIEDIEIKYEILISESIRTFNNLDPKSFSDIVYLGD